MRPLRRIATSMTPSTRRYDPIPIPLCVRALDTGVLCGQDVSFHYDDEEDAGEISGTCPSACIVAFLSFTVCVYAGVLSLRDAKGPQLKRSTSCVVFDEVRTHPFACKVCVARM